MDDEVEKILTSLLNSTKRSMTVKYFCKEFEEMVGYPVPFKQQGYLSVIDYLKSMPNTVMVIGTGINAELRPVLKEKSYHIHDMIMKQKDNGKKLRFNRPNRRNYHTLPQKQVIRRFHNDFTNKSTINSHVFEQNSVQTYLEKNEQSTSTSNMEQNVRQHNKVFPPVEVHDPETSSSSSDTNTSNKNISLNNSRVDNTSYLNNSQGAIPRRLKEPKMVGFFEQTKKTHRVPKFVVDRLQMIIDKYPDGIPCNSLPHLYLENFREALSFSEYGYPSLIFMCKDTNIFYIVQPEVGDYQLYSRKNKRPESKYLLSFNELDSDIANSSDSSHVLEFDNFQTFLYYPPDVVKYEDDIPGQWIDSDTKEGSFINVVVTEVYDPSKFWIVININNLNMFMDDLQSFYNSNHNLKMLKSHMRVGLICVAILYKEFHRVMICNVASINTNIIKVFAFDYGSVREVSTDDVYYLHKQFALFPQQCIRARLAKICPPIEKTPWCQKARFNFCNYVSDRTLLARIHKILEHNTLSLYLIDAEKNLVINDALVDDKVATLTTEVQKPWRRDERNFPVISEIHLVPLFEDLENGTAYNFDERLDLERKSVPLSKIFPEYFKDLTKDIPDLANENIVFEGLNKSFIEALENALSTFRKDKSETSTDTSESVEKQNSSVQESDSSNKEELSASGTTRSRNFLKNNTESETNVEQQHNTTQNVVVNNVTNNEQPKQPEKKLRPPPGYTEMDLLRNRQYNALTNNPNNYNLHHQAHNPMGMNYGTLQMNVFNHYMSVPQPIAVAPMIPIMQSFNPFVNINPYLNLSQFVQPLNTNLRRQFHFSPNTSTINSRSTPTNLNSCNLNTSNLSTTDCNETDLNSANFNQSHLSSSTNLNEEQDTSYETANGIDNSSSPIQQQENRAKELLQNSDNNISDNHTSNYSFNGVFKTELKSKSIHIIFYGNDAFSLVNELLDNYTAVNLPILRIKRLVHMNTSWSIQEVNLKDCPSIKDTLSRFNLITKYHITDEIHIIPVNVIPEFLSIFGILIEDDKFKMFLNTLV